MCNITNDNLLKQINAELNCFNRKIENLREAIELKDMDQIEIEFSNVVLNFEEVKGSVKDLSDNHLNDHRVIVPLLVL